MKPSLPPVADRNTGHAVPAKVVLPALERLRLPVEAAVGDELGVESAVTGEVDVLEEHAVQRGRNRVKTRRRINRQCHRPVGGKGRRSGHQAGTGGKNRELHVGFPITESPASNTGATHHATQENERSLHSHTVYHMFRAVSPSANGAMCGRRREPNRDGRDTTSRRSR